MAKVIMPTIARAMIIRIDRGKDSTANQHFSERGRVRACLDVGVRLKVYISTYYRKLALLIPKDLPTTPLRTSQKPQDVGARELHFHPSCGVPGAVFETGGPPPSPILGLPVVHGLGPTSGERPILGGRHCAPRGQPHVISSRGSLPGSNITEDRLNVVVEAAGIRLPDGPEFINDWVRVSRLHSCTPP
jgi:hypothetical protein